MQTTTLLENQARRRLSWPMRARFIASALSVLFLAQLLSGVLLVSANRKTAFGATATAVRIVGHDWAFRIQNALRFGKPITQMFGLPEMLASIRADLPLLSGVLVMLPAGSIVERNGIDALPASLGPAVEALLSKQGAGRLPDSAATLAQTQIDNTYVFVIPVSSVGGKIAGALVMLVPAAVISQAAAGPTTSMITFLVLTTLCGGLGLVLVSLLLTIGPSGQIERWKLLLIPSLVLALVQGLASWRNIVTFRDAYVEAATSNVQRSVDRFGIDLQHLVNKGVRLDSLSGYGSPFGRMAEDIPELAGIALADGLGRPIAAYGGSEGGEPRLQIRRDILGRDSRPVAHLSANLSKAAIAAGLRRRVLDAGTVLLTSALFGIELLVLFGVLMRQLTLRSARAGVEDCDEHHLLARPASFLLVFSWALPLSFVPLQMRALAPEPLFGLSPAVTLALPISAEMGCALVTALVAGILTDRRGWHVPFVLGSLICAAGALSATLVTEPLGYIGARAIVGLGYGLAWMGIQGYVFTWSSPRTRTQAIANLVAGIFAGQICGNVTGAMLADQIGFASVFAAAAILGLVPTLFAFVFMRSWFGRPEAGGPASGNAEAVSTPLPITPKGGSALWSLLSDRNFLALLLLSVLPFSIAQVGLLYYTIPIYLSQQGIDQGNIGRIMMIYGLSVIYIAPLLGRLVDRHGRRKPFIVLGGLLGSLGLVFIYLDAGIAVLIGSVFLLGLASSFGGPAQSSFALHLPSVHLLGTGRAMGIQRAADKCGQMIGPLALGSLFTYLGTRNGLAVTGVYYLGSTLLFLLVAREHGGRRARELQSSLHD